ncbi:hypothetical protein, partial [Candidatus Endomicrobiellum pyrsonymphae]
QNSAVANNRYKTCIRLNKIKSEW